jgi:hypothetical protein
LIPYTNAAPKFYLSPGTIDDPDVAERIAATGGADAFISVAAGKSGGVVPSFVTNYSAGENECSCEVLPHPFNFYFSSHLKTFTSFMYNSDKAIVFISQEARHSA